MIHIVTDSMSDILQEEAAALGIRVLPLHVRFGADEYADGVDLDRGTFYAMLEKAGDLPQTSQVTPEAFRKAFKEALQAPEDEVVCITGSSKLSGTWQSANLAIGMLEEAMAARVHLVDSRSASLGEALLVHLALASRPMAKDAAALKQALEDYKTRQQLVGHAATLKYLVKGGRLSVVGGALGTVLSIKPMLRLEKGKLNQAGICRGAGKVRQWYVERLRECPPDPAVPMFMAHAHAPEDLAMLRQEVEASGLTLPPIMEMEVGAVIGTHTGPGLLAIAWSAKQAD